jgi:hypothetical protein
MKYSPFFFLLRNTFLDVFVSVCVRARACSNNFLTSLYVLKTFKDHGTLFINDFIFKLHFYL